MPASTTSRPGPTSSSSCSSDRADWLLLAGDATALPAIGSLVEALPAGARALACVEVAGPADEQSFTTRADLTVRWVHADGRQDALPAAVRALTFPPGPVFAWLAGEAGAVRALRRHLVDERGIDKGRIDFSGYWRRTLTQDDAPTQDDLAEAQERLAAAPSPQD